MQQPVQPIFPPSWWSGNDQDCCEPCPPCPPCPPLCPPGPAGAIAKANSCFDQSQQLTALLTQVLTDILNSPAGQQLLTDEITEILQTVPGIAPPGGGVGVVDGSKALPGHVGEVILLTQVIPFAAYPAVTEPIVTLGVLPAGDWDLNVSMTFALANGNEAAIGGASFALQGGNTTNDMKALSIFGVTQGQALEGAVLIGQKSSESISAPEVVSFQVVINQSIDASLPAGNATMTFEARRMR